ncbi:MAG TPA: hypothetical protein PK413_04300 [Thermoanaerobaculia bacterium]|nr:hypothetical protein [Thermoanaerobaculia bacterium]
MRLAPVAARSPLSGRLGLLLLAGALAAGFLGGYLYAESQQLGFDWKQSGSQLSFDLPPNNPEGTSFLLAPVATADASPPALQNGQEAPARLHYGFDELSIEPGKAEGLAVFRLTPEALLGRDPLTGVWSVRPCHDRICPIPPPPPPFQEYVPGADPGTAARWLVLAAKP